MPGVILYPRRNMHDRVTRFDPVEGIHYPNATGWTGNSSEAISIHEGDNVIACWDTGTWHHVELADARNQRDTAPTQRVDQPHCTVHDCSGGIECAAYTP